MPDALDRYLARPDADERVKALTVPGWDVSEVPPALNALCEQLAHMKERRQRAQRNGSRQLKRALKAEAERDALRAENERLLEMLKLAEADIKVMIGEAKPCPHTNHTYRNHGGTKVCADCGETLEDV